MSANRLKVRIPDGLNVGIIQKLKVISDRIRPRSDFRKFDSFCSLKKL